MLSKPPPVAPENFSPNQLNQAGEEMKLILAETPQLGDLGFDVFDPRSKTAERRAQKLAREREDIQTPRSLAAFIASRQWLSKFPKIKALNKRGTSYGLKHRAEHDIGYITNGVFIASASAEGFRVQRAREAAAISST
jgi:hypothetical protein